MPIKVGSPAEKTLRFLGLLGLNPAVFLALRYIPRYFSDRKRFLAAGGQITGAMPVLTDYHDAAGSARGHYFHQDLLVASYIHEANPARHVDVGSRIDGFVAHVAAFREIEILDIRPLTGVGHPRIRFTQCDLMAPPSEFDATCDSISCLHALEHFGLGRYGDPIDPDGHRKGFASLVRMLRPGGTLYLSFPIGQPAVLFNAHRIFAPTAALEWAKDRLELKRFDYVDDAGDLHRQADPTKLSGLIYGCGIYTFSKL